MIIVKLSICDIGSVMSKPKGRSRKEIFISYGREDEVKDFVKKLKDSLEGRRLSSWLDITDIPAGSDWHAEIGVGLQNCRALIAIITKKYISSRFCKKELYGANTDGKKIFPIIFEDFDLGASGEVGAGVKYVISDINWTFFRKGKDDFAESVAKLIDGLNAAGIKGNHDCIAACAP